MHVISFVFVVAQELLARTCVLRISKSLQHQCVHMHAYHVKFIILITCHETSETLTHEYKIYQQTT